jgi:tetratricopeptide (TPR) repeat protein
MNMHTEQKVLSFPEARRVAIPECGDELGAVELAAILRLEPTNVPALINLGTMKYNQGKYKVALSLYRRATVADPGHPLALFNLGNALDELGQYSKAAEAYRRALAIDPRYADAHYNLALSYSRMGERRKAIPHWSKYAKLDPSSAWTDHARHELRRALQADPLQLVG